MGKCKLSKTFIYNNAHVNVLKEALPFQKDHISKGIKRKIRIQNIKITIMKIQRGWFNFFPNYVLYIELEDMSSQNVHRLIVK